MMKLINSMRFVIIEEPSSLDNNINMNMLMKFSGTDKIQVRFVVLDMNNNMSMTTDAMIEVYKN